jgi:two-component system invasion response regulator UvrY
MTHTVLIADDHILVRLGIEIIVREVLGTKCIVDTASDGKELKEKLVLNVYDILITDINMPYNEGFEIMSLALGIQPNLKILIVSVDPEAIFAHRFLRLGAYGYVQKSNCDEELRKAIKEIGIGRRYVTVSQTQQFTNAFLGKVPENPFNSLSAREFEVAMLIVKGLGVLEISCTLFIKSSTASTYKGRVFEKLGVKNAVELSNLARRCKVGNIDAMSH